MEPLPPSPPSLSPPAVAVRRLRLVLACESAVDLGPFAGFALHGALKAHLDADPAGAPLTAPPAGTDPAFRDAPRPFVLHLGEPARARFRPDDFLSLEVRLIGAAAAGAAGAVERAAGALAARGLGAVGGPSGRVRVVEVTEPAGDGLPEAAPARVRVRLETPLRLTAGRVPVDAAAFALPLFARALVQRAAAAASGAGGRPEPALVEALCAGVRVSSQAVGWQDLHRRTREKRHPAAGLRGSFVLEGDLGALWPWLRLGALLHVGGKTTMGLGQVALAPSAG